MLRATSPRASAVDDLVEARPAARPTAAAASALWTESRPRAGIVTGRRPPRCAR